MAGVPVDVGNATPTVDGVVEVAVTELRPWEGNPRRISPERLHDLKHALEADREMLRARPVLALPDGTVFAGNQRLRAAHELGWETIPVLYVELEWERARTWALRDNNIWGEWDEPALAELLAELTADGVELALTGFSSGDLDRILGTLKPASDPDDAPALPDEDPDSTPGQLYELGPHRLLCGDATDSGQVSEVMHGTVASVLWTDPPYGIEYVGKTADALTIANDDGAGLPMLLSQAFSSADAVLEPGARFYIFAPAGPRGTEFRLAVRDVGWQLHQTLVWAKQTPVLGHSDYHYQHEDVLYGWNPAAADPVAAVTEAHAGTATTDRRASSSSIVPRAAPNIRRSSRSS
jgi:hypothetical protein